MNKISFQEFKGCLQAIKNETVPVYGHTDTGAIDDCWKTVEDFLEEPRIEYEDRHHGTFINAMVSYKMNEVNNHEIKEALILGANIFDKLLNIKK